MSNLVDLSDVDKNSSLNSQFIADSVDSFFELLNVMEGTSSERDSIVLVLGDKNDKEDNIYIDMTKISDKRILKSIKVLLKIAITKISAGDVIKDFEDVLKEKEESILPIIDQLQINDKLKSGIKSLYE